MAMTDSKQSHTPTPYSALVPGKWYAIGFELFSTVDAPRIEYYEILQYHGDKEWTNDAGDVVESLWDPELQMAVAVDAADDYASQS
jgi:hypothetical protein